MSSHYDDWSKQRSIMQQRIDLLHEQINEFKKREEDTKKLNNTLIAAVKELNNEESRVREAELLIINEELRVELKHVNRRHEDIVAYYQGQVAELKEELRDARKELGLRDVELERAKGAYQAKVKAMQLEAEHKEEDVRRLALQVEESNSLRERLETELENAREQLQSNQQLTKRRDFEELRASHLIESKARPSFQFMKTSTGQTQPEQLDTPNTQNNMNASNISGMNRRKQRVQQFMKKDKQQIKMMISTLLKAKEKLEQGDRNVSCLQDRSTFRQSFTGGQQPNRTFYK